MTTSLLGSTMDAASLDVPAPPNQRAFEVIRTLGPARILGLASAVAAVLAILIYVSVLVATPDYDVLFSRLPVEASGAIVKKLEAGGERYRLDDGGTTILVDRGNVARLRVMVAESKLIAPGSLGYELLDRADPLSTTNSLFQVNRIRALEGELARTIAAVEGIESARVHLVIPMRELFSQSVQEARASIVLKSASDRVVPKKSVEAIQQIVSGSVRDLSPARVAVMDTKGNLLARGDGDAQSVASGGVFERKMEFERRTREGIERMLEQYVGLGKVRADVTADFNLTSVNRSSEIYDPKGRVERSVQVVEEGANRENTRQNKDASIRNNLPEGQSQTTPGQQSKDVTNRTEETTNYEVSKSVIRETTEPGALTRLSVAVLIDGRYSGGTGTEPATYEARSEQEIQQLSRLVRSLVGFNGDRGDVVEVINLPFVVTDPKTVVDGGPLLSKQEMIRLAQVGFLGLLALAIALFAARPVIRALRPETTEETDLLQIPEGSTALVPVELDDVSQLKAEIEREMQDLESKRSAALADMIDIDKIEGQVQASAVKRITEIFDKHPDEAVSVMRTWLSQRA